MPTIQIEVEDDLLRDLKNLFPQNESATNKLASLAFQEWVTWLKGLSRPTTISEQNIQRFIDIYSKITPGEVPDVETLYNKFNIPLGQARYITQAISYKKAGLIYSLTLKEILDSFDNGKVDQISNSITIKIHKTSEKALREIIYGLAYQDESIPTPLPLKELGKFVYYNIRNIDVDKIKQKLKEKSSKE